MGGSRDSSPQSSEKHRRLYDDEDDVSDDSFKRHKHHHHHRHRRHRSEVGVKDTASAAMLPPEKDEREEGEILDEEEEGEIKSDVASFMDVDFAADKILEGELVKGTLIDNAAKDMESLSDIVKEKRSRDHGQSNKNSRRDYKEKKYKDADKKDEKSRARSRSLVARNGEHSGKPKRRDDRVDRVSGYSSDNLVLHKQSELDKNSYQAYSWDHDEVRYQERSESPVRLEKLNGDSDNETGGVREIRELSKRTSNDDERSERGRSTSQICEKQDRRERERHTIRDRDEEDRGERERSSSRIHDDGSKGRKWSTSRIHDERRRERERSTSGNDERRERKGSASRVHGVGKRDRERSPSSSRLDGRKDRHPGADIYMERDGFSRSLRERHTLEFCKELRQDSERSSSRSRHDSREGRRSSQDKIRESGRHHNSNRERDREAYRERESMDRYQEYDCKRVSDRHRDGDDRDRRVERDRESFRDRERTGHRDSRDSRYDDVLIRKERGRSNVDESAKKANSIGNDSEGCKEKVRRDEEEKNYQDRIEQQLAKEEEEDIDKIKEESRKRKLAILEKKQLRSQQQGEFHHEKVGTELMDMDKTQALNETVVVDRSAGVKTEGKNDASDECAIDPSFASFALGKSPAQADPQGPEKAAGASGLGEGTPKSERSTDMFCDDIFGESPAAVCKSGKGDGRQIERSGFYDNWDDAEGYYSYRFGEVLDGRYEVIAAHGKGVFSTVVRAKDLKASEGDLEVAIKIIRNNETMHKAGLEELNILKKLVGADPEDKRHCVRCFSSFKYRYHLCLVFESLHMNLREVLKKFGRNIGLKLTAVRSYAKQLFIALKHLRNCGVLHCDIKPDNMLVNEAKNVLKVCDFGNAMLAGKNEITPYLVSRFYRAPEIILGLPYDHPLDMWSVGCCLYELYTGKVLFPGPSNNDMLRLHMDLKGPFPKKMLRKGAFTDQHFDQDLNFLATEEDPVTKKTIKRLLINIKPKDFGPLISGSPGEDPKMLANFRDLLERIFILDPEKRLTVSQALSHSFITGK